MKQLFFVVFGRNDNYKLAGIYGDIGKAKIAAKGYGEDNADHFEVKIYSGNFGIVEIRKGVENA